MLTGRRLAGTSVMSVPAISTFPLSGMSRPAIIRSSVVLPQPELPSSEKNSPSAMSRLTRSSATVSS